MNRSLTCLLALALCVPAAAHAQRAPLSPVRIAELVPVPGILRNSVSNLHAEGDSLWVGPFLNLTVDGGAEWFVPEADSLLDTPNRVFSIDAEGPVVWAGLGYSARGEGDQASVPAAGGFLYSTDGGQTFTYRLPQLDAPGDSTLVYGVSTLKALDVIVPQQSPPYDIDYDAATGDVWVAGWASGIRRSRDAGRTWERVVLPPDELMAVHPDSSYDFVLAPERGSQGSRNHMGFSVLVDETGTVWAGTAAGLNRSTDGGVAWQRFVADGTEAALTGSWVVSIEEQPLPGRNPVWMATWSTGDAGERYGVTVTRDGGATFEQHLPGVEVIDFAFQGETVYVAGRQNGLYVSEDGGLTWRTLRHFRDATRPDRPVRPGVDVVAVATTDDALWVGTDDGLLRSTDDGASWRLFRAEVPLHPETPTAEVPDVDTYAYPNPFSPQSDRFVRIRYELERNRSVDVRIFDFGMNLVRLLSEGSQMEGAREVVWDGTDDAGARVANGTYFYAVEAGDDTFWGKILVLE